MEPQIFINNEQEVIELGEDMTDLLLRAARLALQEGNVSQGELSIALVDDDRIKELNSIYRREDKATDVLSFPLDEELLGDVVISVPRARDQSEEYGCTLEFELSFLVVHGVLHLLGFDHEEDEERTDMRKREKRILAELGFLWRDAHG